MWAKESFSLFILYSYIVNIVLVYILDCVVYCGSVCGLDVA